MDNQPLFNIQRLYLKHALLEQPNSPGFLIEQEQPTVELSLDVAVEPVTLRPNVHEITVDATVQAKIKDKILFRVECKQAGLFEILNVDNVQLDAILHVVCPQIIYPYLRSNITDLVVRGGFTPVHLAEINFHALHEQRKAQQRGQGRSTQAQQADSNALLRAALQRAQEQSAQATQAVVSAAATTNQKKKKKGSS